MRMGWMLEHMLVFVFLFQHIILIRKKKMSTTFPLIISLQVGPDLDGFLINFL